MALNETQKKILDKVMKLLNMTESNGCSKAEAESGQRLAKEIMSKYGMSQEDLASKDTASDFFYITGDDGYALEKVPVCIKNLYNAVYRNFGVYLLMGTHEGYEVFYFSGETSDIEVADYCVERLYIQINESAEEYRVKNKLRRNSVQYTSFLDTIVHYACKNLEELLKGVDSPFTLKDNSSSTENSGTEVTIYSRAVVKVAEGKQRLMKHLGINPSDITDVKTRTRYNKDGEEASKGLTVNGAVGSNGSRQAQIGVAR